MLGFLASLLEDLLLNNDLKVLISLNLLLELQDLLDPFFSSLGFEVWLKELFILGENCFAVGI